MAEQPTRTNIPAEMQRGIRQRCGFGCVLCGLPLYEYDHLLGWANVQRHVASEITLLCDRHHREKTSGLLTDVKVAEANADPCNRRLGVSAPYALHYEGDLCEVVIGGNRFTAVDRGYGTMVIPVAVDQAPLLGMILGDGHILLTLNLFDEYNHLVACIVNNHLLYSTSPWDIQLKGRRLVIREAARRFLLDMQFDPPNRVVVNRARFLRNGVEVLAWPNRLVADEAALFTGCEWENVTVAVSVGERIPGVSIGLDVPNVSRYPAKRSEATRWAREIDWTSNV